MPLPPGSLSPSTLVRSCRLSAGRIGRAIQAARFLSNCIGEGAGLQGAPRPRNGRWFAMTESLPEVRPYLIWMPASHGMRQVLVASDDGFEDTMSSAPFSSPSSTTGRCQAPPRRAATRDGGPLPGTRCRFSSDGFDGASPIASLPVRLMPHQPGCSPLPALPHRVHLTCS